MTNEQRREQAEAIAKALGWTLEQPHEGNSNYYRLVSPEGVTISMNVGGYAYKGRISFGTLYPQHQSDQHGATRYTSQRDWDRSLPYNQSGWDGITVADTKSPEQIAKDLNRRFLPVYLPLWAEAVKYCAQQASYWARRSSHEAAIKEAVKGVAGLNISYMGSDYARLEIDASPELAKVLADAVKAYRATVAS